MKIRSNSEWAIQLSHGPWQPSVGARVPPRRLPRQLVGQAAAARGEGQLRHARPLGEVLRQLDARPGFQIGMPALDLNFELI